MTRTSVALSMSFCLIGCAGTLRDDRGTVHDSRFAAKQAHDLVTNAPLLIPFVPVGVVGNGIKASVENGRISLAGEVVDENGALLSNVSMRVIQSRLVTFDLNDDSPVFWEEAKSRDVDGDFSVNLYNTHTVRLEFTKDGFENRDYHFELVRKGGWPWDASSAATQPVYGQSPIVEPKLRVVMKRAPAQVAATRPAA
ncbi:MAG: hypothetical protein WBD40_24245 [Tepidisphaeraceae bacterium]